MTDPVAAQTALYGEPLSARFGRVLAAYGIPQSRLAQVIGLSAPMLSQLAGARRVKISNPSVYARLLRLEEIASRERDPARLAAALDEVAASQPSLTTGQSSTSHEAVLELLAELAPREQLHAAAAAVPGTALAGVLHAAAGRATG